MIRLSSDIEKVAIQIAQRRTFLERYSRDLENSFSTSQNSGSFEPPPSYAQSPHTQNPMNPRPQSQTFPTQATLPLSGGESASVPEDQVMTSIRETLYAAIAEALATSNTTGPILKEDPPRG